MNQVNVTLQSMRLWQTRDDYDTILLGVQEKGTRHQAAYDPGFWLGILAYLDHKRHTDKAAMVKIQLGSIPMRRGHCLRVLRVLHEVATECNVFFCKPNQGNCNNRTRQHVCPSTFLIVSTHSYICSG